ncbi:terminase small subunit [Brucella sp. TWI432]
MTAKRAPAKKAAPKKAIVTEPKAKQHQPVELNRQMAIFAQEYMKDMNATKAAIRAGYSEKAARQQGSRLLGYYVVNERIQELYEESQRVLKKNAEQFLTELLSFNSFDMIDIYERGTRCFKPMDEWPKIFRTELLQSIKIFEKFEMVMGEDGKKHKEKIGEIVEVKLVDRLRIKDFIGKTIGAWREKKEEEKTDDPVGELWQEISGRSFEPQDD